MDYQSIEIQQYCLKTMQHASHKLRKWRLRDIKNDRTKQIPWKFFSFSQVLEKDKKINIQYIRSNDHATNLFTKIFFTIIFRKFIRDIGICHLRDLWRKTIHVNLMGSLYGYTFFYLTVVLSHWVFLVRFLTRQHMDTYARMIYSFSLRYDFIPLGFHSKF